MSDEPVIKVEEYVVDCIAKSEHILDTVDTRHLTDDGVLMHGILNATVAQNRMLINAIGSVNEGIKDFESFMQELMTAIGIPPL